MDIEAAKPTSTVLIVDDDAPVAKVLGALLSQVGIEPLCAASGEAALALLTSRPVDVVVTDLRMPGMDGNALVSRIKAQWPAMPVVMMTAHGTVAAAVEAMKRGAADFVLKPFERDDILYVVRKALWAAHHTDGRPERVPMEQPGSTLLGRSAAMRECDELITRAARGQATVLLRGESGTGKELAARAIHDRSTRKLGPFIVVHAAALPESLLESELFGHEKGAFTGAVARKPGRVELAEGGTLFLDELGDIPLAMQVKLLRLIQERQVQRLGGSQTIKVDVRFVAATHRNLEAMVAAGEFREDLFFRLNVIGIRLPPLRERPGDVEELASHFCAQLGAANGRPEARLEQSALTLLGAQRWNGNVRELQNFIERLVVMSEHPAIDAAIVARELERQFPGAECEPAAAQAGPRTEGASLNAQRRETETAALIEALRKSGNNRTVAARILGVGRRTLYNKLKDLGLE